MGSISGVSPTATESEKSRAASQSPFVMPETRSTTGSMTAMRRMSRRLVELMPSSNAVWRLRPASVPVASPNMVRAPVATTMPRALPEMTVEPMKARSQMSVSVHFSLPGRLARASVSGRFSTGSDSPVRDDWLTNRSRAAKMRRSAGTTSPEERWMTSPTTTSSSGMGLPPSPSRSTLAQDSTISARDCAATVLFSSCTKRMTPETSTMMPMMAGVVRSRLPTSANTQSVSTETAAMSSRMYVNGSANAASRRSGSGFLAAVAVELAPQNARASSTWSEVRPSSRLLSSLKSSGMGAVATWRSHSCWVAAFWERVTTRWLRVRLVMAHLAIPGHSGTARCPVRRYARRTPAIPRASVDLNDSVSWLV